MHRRARSVATERHRATLLALRAGLAQENVITVQSLLHPDVTVLVDRGAAVTDAPGRVRGDDLVAIVLLALVAGTVRPEISAQSVNGQTGLVFRHGQRVVGVLCAATTGDRILSVWVVLNPAKLRDWN